MEISIKEKRRIAEEVCGMICSLLDVSPDNIKKKDKTKKVAMARNFTLYVLHKRMGYSANYLSFEFDRDARTIFKSCALMDTYLKIYDDYKEMYKKICAEIEKVVSL